MPLSTFRNFGLCLCLGACAAVVTGCKKSSAIEVTVEVDSAVKSTCLKVVAIPSSGVEQLTVGIARKDKVVVAVYPSAELSGTLQLVARGYVGKGCDEPLTLNDESAPVSETFTEGQVRPVTLRLRPPQAEQDADADGYRGQASGGPDCDDGSASVHPGATEGCSNGIDDNCDGKSDCADPTCLNVSCDDGQRCTESDKCAGNGTCTGTPLLCPLLGPCNAGVCNPANGSCDYHQVDAGGACDDLNPCTTGDVCLADAGCRGGAVTCNTPSSSCYAATGVCKSDAGGCVYAPLDAGTACSDNNACTSTDRCNGSGTCAGQTVVCNASPGPCFSSSGTCVAGDGGCVYPALTGSACSDGNACTTGETCQSNGTCANGNAFTCATPPAGCFSAAGMCLSDGGCAYQALDAGAACSDGNPCTVNDVCTGAGTCAGSAATCSTPPNSCFGSAGACQADGGCAYPALDAGVACNDGNPCSLGDVCQGDGTCLGATSYTCTAPPNSCFQAAGACQGDGGCTYSVDPARLYQTCTTGLCLADGGCGTPGFPFTVSNFNPSSLSTSAVVASVTLNCNNAVFDSSADAGVNFVNWCGQPQPGIQVVTQAGGPDAVLLAMGNFTIGSGGILSVVGSRPVIFAVYDNATIAGQLTGTASFSSPGAGAATTSCGASAGSPGTTASSRGGGGGGGGFLMRGADGGVGNNPTAIGGLGGTDGGTVALVPLRGGCPGGNGGAGGVAGGLGGAGGGALQVSAGTSLAVDGVVSVSGGGGRGGPGNNAGAGAGGTGGGVLLESAALSLSATARVTANGGSGGKGAANSAGGVDGQNGSTTTATPVPGGTGGASGGNGGAGGAGVTAPGAGANSNNGGGGAGGSAGRIRLNGNGACTIDGAAVVSPPASKQGCP